MVCDIFESRKPAIIRYRIISSSYDSCNVLLAGKAGDVMNESTGSPSSCQRILNFFVRSYIGFLCLTKRASDLFDTVLPVLLSIVVAQSKQIKDAVDLFSH